MTDSAKTTTTIYTFKRRMVEIQEKAAAFGLPEDAWKAFTMQFLENDVVVIVAYPGNTRGIEFLTHLAEEWPWTKRRGAEVWLVDT